MATWLDGKKIQVQDLARDNEPCLVLRSKKPWQRKASQGLSSDLAAYRRASYSLQ